MGFKDRIGIDLGRSIALEEGIAWAAKNSVRYFDAQTDIAPNALESFDDRRCAASPKPASGTACTSGFTRCRQ